MQKLKVLVLLFFNLIYVIHGLTINENKLVAFPNKVNNFEASRICKSEGLNLVKIENEASNQIVYNFAAKYGLGPFWIDGNDKAVEGKWKYIDGQNMIYSKWHVNEPNNLYNEDCIQGYRHKRRSWNDISCEAKLDVICYGEAAVHFTQNQLVIIPGHRNYSKAIYECESRGYNLVKIQNEQMDQMVFEFAKKNNLRRYWIDGNDIDNEGKWVYRDRSSLVYTNWSIGEPNNLGNEDCIQVLFNNNGYWNDISCERSNTVICYAAIITDENLVAFPKHVNYFEALRICKSEGMNLLQITNEQTNDKAYDFAVNNDLGEYWINGIYSEGNWEYSDGSYLEYSKWYEEKSSNFENKNCIRGLFYEESYWEETSCNSNKTVICQGAPSLSYTVNNLVFLQIQATYHQALILCRTHGLYLVKVYNEDINRMIYSFAVKENVGKYWIDGNDNKIEGNWVNSDEEKLIYSKWYTNEPNNFNEENCVIGLWFTDGYWNDIGCNSLNSVICYGGAKRK